MKASNNAQPLYAFRVVVRGNNDGRRVRRVRTVMATNEGVAAQKVEQEDPHVLAGLVDLYVTVLPPLAK